jgi:hypothetical protein
VGFLSLAGGFITVKREDLADLSQGFSTTTR